MLITPKIKRAIIRHLKVRNRFEQSLNKLAEVVGPELTDPESGWSIDMTLDLTPKYSEIEIENLILNLKEPRKYG